MGSIARFLSGKALLVTGATGFLAKALVEKVLREAPGIGRIHLLIRPRTGPDGRTLDAEERLDREILESSAFARLRREWGEGFRDLARAKLSAVPGDLTRDGLGLSEENHRRLAGEVDVVINSAATVVFDERVDAALELNTLGPRRMVKFARSCRDAVLVHVSTAYVNGIRTGRIPEETIPPDTSVASLLGNGRGRTFSLDSEIAWIRERSDEIEAASRDAERLARFRRTLERRNRGRRVTPSRYERQMEGLRTRWVRERLVELGMRRAQDLGWHDNYTFTKAMGEQVVCRHRGGLPTAIVRPSIIESSFLDPEPGWLDGLKVADPVITHFGKGRLRDFPGDPEVVLDLIPVDMVANTILAVLPHVRDSRDVRVYHVATGTENPLAVGEMFAMMHDYFSRNPMRHRDGSPIEVPMWNFPSLRKFKRDHRIRYQIPLGALTRLMDLMPALPWSPRLRSKASVLPMIDRLLSFSEIYSPYTNLKCEFETRNARDLWDSLDPEDRATFPFDVSRIRWREYIQEVHIPGLKRHVLKPSDRATAPMPPGPRPRTDRPAESL